MQKMKMPNTLVLIFATVILIAILTWIVPGGEYTRQEIKVEGKTRIVPIADSFKNIPHIGQHIQVLTAPVKGFQEAAAIIVFLFIIGGAFFVIQETGAITVLISKTARFLSKNPSLKILFIPVIMTIFSAGGAIFGMSEEVMPFILIFVPLALSLGYDTIVGVAIPFLGAAAGFGGAFFNPFTVGIAQGIAQIPVYSGLPYRILVWIISTGAAIAFVMIYASKIQKNPEKSIVYEEDLVKRQELHITKNDTEVKVKKRHIAVLIAFVMGIVILIIGILKWQWYIEEIAGLFFAMGIICGILGGLDLDHIAKSFATGAKDMMNPVLIIATARGILIIAQDGKILDTILHFLSTSISHFHPLITAWLMFYVQCIINFFIHSGSGQAALTMPIMAPLSDLVGITRQTAVLAFQLCELINPVLPTSGVTMGILGLAMLPWTKWVKWFSPLLIIYILLSMILLIWPVLTHWN